MALAKHPVSRLCLLGTMFLAGAVTAARGQNVLGGSPPGNSTPITAEVRAADVRDVVAQLGTALQMQLSADAGLGGRRITMHCQSQPLTSFQNAIAQVYRTRWESSGRSGALRASTDLDAASDRLRRQRWSGILARLLALEYALTQWDENRVTEQVRRSVRFRAPYLPSQSIEQITPSYLRQALLAAPLRSALGTTLIRYGNVAAPLSRLSPANQELVARYFEEQTRPPDQLDQDLEADRALRIEALRSPQARIEYRILYGDRWTGNLILIRVGVPDHWATATLPSVLFDLPDWSALYPERDNRTADPELGRSIELNVDTENQNWDQALLTVARTAGINIISDSFPRPDVYTPPARKAPIAGTTLAETLDNLALHYGYFWWKSGDWFYFRHAYWGEEQRVSVPERILQSLSRNLDDERLTSSEVLQLAPLSDEQLLTLHLFGSAAGRIAAPTESFDFGEIQLIRSGIAALSQLPAADRETVLGEGEAVLRMPRGTQTLFRSLARDRNYPLDPETQRSWVLRIGQEFHHERLAAGYTVRGQLGITFDFGPAGERTAILAMRTPAAEQQPAGPTAQPTQ